MTMAVTLSSYWRKQKNSTMEIKGLSTLVLNILKTLSNLNPIFIKEIFYISAHNTHRRHNISVQSEKIKHGGNNFRVLGPDLWNALAEKIKSTTTMFVFKDFVLTWSVPKCRCKLCSI